MNQVKNRQQGIVETILTGGASYPLAARHPLDRGRADPTGLDLFTANLPVSPAYPTQPALRDAVYAVEERGVRAHQPVRFLFQAPHVEQPLFVGGQRSGSEFCMMSYRHDPNAYQGYGFALPQRNRQALADLLAHGVQVDEVVMAHQMAPQQYAGQPWTERVLPPPPPRARDLSRSLGRWSALLQKALIYGEAALLAGASLAAAGTAIGVAATLVTVATIDPIVLGVINGRQPGTRPRAGDPCAYVFLTAWDWEVELP